MPSYVNIENVEEGMILAENLTNKFGQVMAKSGVEIKEIHIKMLKTWSIDGILVMEKNEKEIELSEKEKEKYLGLIHKKIGFVPSNNVEKDLSESILIHMLKYNKVEISR